MGHVLAGRMKSSQTKFLTNTCRVATGWITLLGDTFWTPSLSGTTRPSTFGLTWSAFAFSSCFCSFLGSQTWVRMFCDLSMQSRAWILFWINQALGTSASSIARRMSSTWFLAPSSSLCFRVRSEKVPTLQGSRQALHTLKMFQNGRWLPSCSRRFSAWAAQRPATGSTQKKSDCAECLPRLTTGASPR